jgi:hypothetical protein
MSGCSGHSKHEVQSGMVELCVMSIEHLFNENGSE